MQTHNVTWDISHVPKQISNGFRIQLRYNGLITPCTSRLPSVPSGFADISTVVLADAFDPRAGHVAVTVPWVISGNYSLVLFGDSGNYSPEFQILGGPVQ
jgi:hypothetical protein